MNFVDRKSYKIEAFFRKLAKHLTLDEKANYVVSDGLYYLGGGYWRAKPVSKDGEITGVRLINPSKTADEIEIVAQAMNVLL